MTQRALKRPRHGWARTAAEKADQAATSGLLQAICICWLAMISIAVFGSTVKTLELLIGF